jgi:DeoR/GlpR family transcriptional regulator of sugar metabolism
MGYEYHTGSVKAQVLDELRHTRREIASRASKLVQPGDVIIINCGEASRHLAMALREHKQLTVITNCLPIMEVLSSYPQIKVMLTGGEYRQRSRDLVGPSVTTLLQNIRIDSAFLSVDGLSMDFGASCSDERDAECVSIFSKFSRKTVVLADHSIMGEDANFRGVTLQQIDDIVTDFGVPANQRIDYSARGVGMIMAGDLHSPRDGAADRIL